MAIRQFLSAAVFGFLASEVHAQFLPPPPLVAVPVGPSSAIGFRYHRGGLTVGGYAWSGPGAYVVGPGFGGYYPGPIGYGLGGYPYGVVQNRVTIQYIAPTVVVASPRGRSVEDYDLSGVDLDVMPPPRADREQLLPPPRAAAPPAAPAPVKKPVPQEAPQIAKAPEPKPVVAPKPKADVPKKAEAEKPKAEPPKPAPEPRPDPLDESRRLLDLGTEAFRREEYGVAAMRFRQAVGSAPLEAKSWFWQAHAQIALGKFTEAEESLVHGLNRKRDWPRSEAKPLADLYDNRLDAWQRHRRQVEDLLRRDGEHAGHRFLLGYLLWYEGRRDAAVEQFRLARPGLADPTLADLFLDL